MMDVVLVRLMLFLFSLHIVFLTSLFTVHCGFFLSHLSFHIWKLGVKLSLKYLQLPLTVLMTRDINTTEIL